jgi:hypothetical protein
MEESLIKEEMMMEYNTEITKEDVMQIMATQTTNPTTIIGGILVFIIVGVLIWKTLKNNLPF